MKICKMIPLIEVSKISKPPIKNYRSFFFKFQKELVVLQSTKIKKWFKNIK
jgi:hypothetical protein